MKEKTNVYLINATKNKLVANAFSVLFR